MGAGREATAPFVTVVSPLFLEGLFPDEPEDVGRDFGFFSDGGGLSLSDPELVPEPDAVAELLDASFSVGSAFLLRCMYTKHNSLSHVCC